MPQAFWKQSSNDAIFQWQFHEKANKFYINYQVLCQECEPNTLDTLDNFANALSGEYDVLQRKRKSMEFESTTTRGFEGKKVQIVLSRKNWFEFSCWIGFLEELIKQLKYNYLDANTYLIKFTNNNYLFSCFRAEVKQNRDNN